MDSGYEAVPALDGEAPRSYKPVSTGFGGPGENPYVEDPYNDDIFKFGSDDEEIPSLFRAEEMTAAETEHEDDMDEEGGGDEGDDDDGRNNKRSRPPAPKRASLLPLPSELPPHASASEVVRAWAARLNNVYELCAPPAAARDEDSTQDADDEDEGDENDEKSEQAKRNKANKGFNLFGWGKKGGDENAEAESPSKRDAAKKHHHHRHPPQRQRKFQRGNNTTYDWQVLNK